MNRKPWQNKLFEEESYSYLCILFLADKAQIPGIKQGRKWECLPTLLRGGFKNNIVPGS
jgi:hypothetical protein